VPRRLHFSLAAALVALVTCVAHPALALIVVNNGDEVDGWDIVMPANVTIIQQTNKPTLTVQEIGAFDSLVNEKILFVQASYHASPTITIRTETVTNSTGHKLGGMRDAVSDRLEGNTGSPTITQSFSVSDPARTLFTSENMLPSNVTFTGTFRNGLSSRLGFGSTGGKIVISANPVTSGLKKIFRLNEDPLPAVPLPPACWTGLSGLLGLGAIAGLKKLKKHFV
jgi:hypothetical protein